jgi:hypothetical protein
MDLITALHMSLVAIGPSAGPGDIDANGFSSFATQWQTLLRSVKTELDYWNTRRRVHTRVELLSLLREPPADRDLLSAER